MQLLRKSGGSGSVIGLLYLLLVSLFSYVVYLRSSLIRDIQILSNEQWKGHFIYLETMYYVRNEIYDETCWDLEVLEDEYEVVVDFDKLKKEVLIRVKYGEVIREEKYFFDFNCHCLMNEKKTEEFIE